MECLSVTAMQEAYAGSCFWHILRDKMLLVSAALSSAKQPPVGWGFINRKVALAQVWGDSARRHLRCNLVEEWSGQDTRSPFMSLCGRRGERKSLPLFLSVWARLLSFSISSSIHTYVHIDLSIYLWACLTCSTYSILHMYFFLILTRSLKTHIQSI